MNKTIVHLDMDTFFVSCERLFDPRLNNRPVLIGGLSDRSVVAACSYEARTYGIHSAMPMKMAHALCPHAVVIRGNHEMYSQFSDTVTDIIRDQAPLFEKSSIDEFYIDISGMDQFVRQSYVWVKELREKILKETHLPLSFGLSVNKTVSKVGTGEAKPNNGIEIPRGKERMFLAPLSIRKIPGVGIQTYRFLRSMGIAKIKTIQEIPVEMMESVLGINGMVLWKKARGIDNTPVVQYQERKSISSERTFDKDTTDIQKLQRILYGMAGDLAYQLRQESKLTSCVTVKIRYSDFMTHSMQKRIPYTSLDHSLTETALNLFNKLYNRRVLLRLIGLRFSHLTGGSYQIRLFEDSEKMIRLYQAMDKVRNRFGRDSLKRAVCIQDPWEELS
jgi:DNA polymerase IV